MTTHELKEVLVQATDVSLKFDEKVILKPTTVEVRDIVRPDTCQGQVIGILGPSGVGKTVFSRILAGLQEPTHGSVVVNIGGKMVPVQPGFVGMVAQDYPLFPHRTVLGNLLLALEHTKLSTKDREAKAKEYLDTFELLDKVNKYPSQLSGGQRQRVSIIRELLSSEHYIVMDEPFTGLDPIMKDAVCDLIDKVAKLAEHNTLFVVAHDLPALTQIADQLWLFGRDRNEAGGVIPGATIKKTYNLIERGLAWKPDIASTKQFGEFVAEVREQFKGL